MKKVAKPSPEKKLQELRRENRRLRDEIRMLESYLDNARHQADYWYGCYCVNGEKDEAFAGLRRELMRTTPFRWDDTP